MEYLVMECGRGYAVVLDSEGRFLKVPNLGYEVGQTLDHVVIFDSTSTDRAHKKRVVRWVAMAASICLFIMGGLVWQTPMGTVRMQINPDIQMSINLFGRVVGLDGLNEDGKDLIEGYHVYGKTAEAASYGLADHAMEMGYLSNGGKITLIVESKHSEWKMTTEEKLLSELKLHFAHRIVITTISAGSNDESDDLQDPKTTDPSRDFPQQWDDGNVEYGNEDFEQDDDEDLYEGTDNDPDEDTDDDIDNDMDDDSDDDGNEEDDKAANDDADDDDVGDDADDDDADDDDSDDEDDC